MQARGMSDELPILRRQSPAGRAGIPIANQSGMLNRTGLLATIAVSLVACATAPKTAPERQALVTNAEATLKSMQARDPGLRDLLRNSAGYAVFPSIGKGGFLVGGAYGRGIVYEKGKDIGFVELNQAQLGALLGGETFSELIVFKNPEGVRRLRGGEYNLAGNASAVILQTGAATQTQFGRDGVAVFVMPRGGAMVDVSVAGQRLNFEPKG
jgi:lipid-binding SYLF domain-containing protein